MLQTIYLLTSATSSLTLRDLNDGILLKSDHCFQGNKYLYSFNPTVISKSHECTNLNAMYYVIVTMENIKIIFVNYFALILNFTVTLPINIQAYISTLIERNVDMENVCSVKHYVV